VSGDLRPHRSRPIRLIAVFKLSKAAMSTVVGLGALQIPRQSIVAVIRPVLDALATHADLQAIQRGLVMISALSPRRIEIIAAGAFLYACLCTAEGLGLWWEKRWAEYVVVTATLSLVPFELFALVRHPSFTRLTALLVNLAVAAYLAHCLRRPGPGA
jgi:uncharacterized membrane protein (DUF2068 family)